MGSEPAKTGRRDASFLDDGALFETVPDMYLVLDRSLRILAVTDAYCRSTLTKRDDIVGRDLFEVFPDNPDNPERNGVENLKTSLERVLRDRVPDVMAVQRYDPERPPETGGGFEIRYWSPINFPVLDANGDVRWIIHRVEDVTDYIRLKEAEEKRTGAQEALDDRAQRMEAEVYRSAQEVQRINRRLIESERRLRLALDAANLGEWEYEPLTRRFIRSAMVERLFGFAPGTAGEDIDAFLDRIVPEEKAAYLAAAKAAIASGQPFSLEFRVTHPDGSIHWLAQRGETLAGGESPVAEGRRVIGVIMDVTREKERERSLETLLQQKDLLMHEVNHRVKNNLQLVASLLQLQARSIRDAVARQHFSDACGRVLSIAELHKKLYKWGDFGKLDFGEYLHDLCAELEHSLTADGRAIRIMTEADHLFITADTAVPLALIVNELVTNAVKYAYPDGNGTIRVRLHDDGDGWVLRIEDGGVGLPDGLDPMRAGGIGMMLVRTLTTQVGGILTFERPGPGTRVSLTFPADP